MLENRSFDHLLGGVVGVDGPAGGSNIDPADGSSVAVSFDASPTSPALPDPQHPGDVSGDPHHDFIAVNRQLFEKADPHPDDPVTCGGFIMAGRASGDPDADRIAREVMRCFDTPRTLTTFASLASEFLVCDRWHASVPGPTWPNRLFAHAGTSFGTLDNDLRLFNGTTIYDRLDAAAVDWAIYYHDIPQSLCLQSLWTRRDRLGRRRMRPVDEFYADVRAHRPDADGKATLPAYIFIEPGYFQPSHGLWGWITDLAKWLLHASGVPVVPSRGHANDQHAPHDVRWGEHLMADIYDSLRANAAVWKHCLLIILHDEHGGLYDHVHPQAATPDVEHPSQTPSFTFDRAGLRVPALLISPYVTRGVDQTLYDHTSILRTVRTHFCSSSSPPLTPREASATPVGGVGFTQVPRDDTPVAIARSTATFKIPTLGDASRRAPNDLQRSLLRLAAAVAARAVLPDQPTSATAAPRAGGARPGQPDEVVDLTDMPSPPIASEADGRAFVTRVMEQHQRR
jgi:phospholipase C